MRTLRVPVHPLPFADCVLATAFSPDEVEREDGITDPRRFDLPEDTELWTGLLSRAHALDGEASQGLFGALHGLRCFGARLQSTRTGMRLSPGDMTRAEYRVLREEYLVPHAGVLRRLLTVPPTSDEVELLTA